ncbi:DUF899 domain-containing protein [Geminicoccus roseus]|uniref:DUF899 domain-containing protein n=1 Tax=Geminicoccus roseus TaxID=404900 RepID=UPI00041196C4|nr:thioredoxin family protein [Geminicoccus roseus]
MQTHDIVSREEWLQARIAHLHKEKEFTRARDALAAERRALPWVRVDKPYVFEGPDGKRSLADLFGRHRQLVVQHFMFGPDWEQGCVGCSFMADHVEGPFRHLDHHDVAFAAISRTEVAKIEAFRTRMGWKFPWLSSLHSDFNFDFDVSFTEDDRERGDVFYNYRPQPFESEELPGLSVFVKDEAGQVFHTYSTFARGVEPVMAVYGFLDMTPFGRNEEGGLGDWVRHHDRYAAAEPATACGCAPQAAAA